MQIKYQISQKNNNNESKNIRYCGYWAFLFKETSITSYIKNNFCVISCFKSNILFHYSRLYKIMRKNAVILFILLMNNCFDCFMLFFDRIIS